MQAVRCGWPDAHREPKARAMKIIRRRLAGCSCYRVSRQWAESSTGRARDDLSNRVALSRELSLVALIIRSVLPPSVCRRELWWTPSMFSQFLWAKPVCCKIYECTLAGMVSKGG